MSPTIVNPGFMAGHGKFLYHVALTGAVWVTVPGICSDHKSHVP